MAPKLGIIAGRGDLPSRLVQVCQAESRGVFVLAFNGQTDQATVEGVDHRWLPLGAIDEVIKTFREAEVEQVVMAGAMTRPSFSELKIDFKYAYQIAKLGISSLGDDGLLQAIIKFLEEQGFRVVGVDDVMGQLVAEEGCYGRLEPDEQALSDIERGARVAAALGAQDVGQAAVVQQGLVLGVEAVEGTDALLARCAGLARSGVGGVLVKVRKPVQDRRADLPTIGVTTVEGAARAGLRGIAVEAGGALVIGKADLVTAADSAGLFVVGIPAPG